MILYVMDNQEYYKKKDVPSQEHGLLGLLMTVWVINKQFTNKMWCWFTGKQHNNWKEMIKNFLVKIKIV